MGPPPSTERSADSAAAMAAMAAAASAAYVRPKKPLLARPLIRAAAREAFQNENFVSYRPPLVVQVVCILWSKHHQIKC